MKKTIFVVMDEGKISQTYYIESKEEAEEEIQKLQERAEMFLTVEKEFEPAEGRDFAVILSFAKNGMPLEAEISNSEADMISQAKNLAKENMSSSDNIEVMVSKFYIYDGWSEILFHAKKES